MRKKILDFCKDNGSYGIAASAVKYSYDLPTYLRITDINDDGTLNCNSLKSVDDPKNINTRLKAWKTQSPPSLVNARCGLIINEGSERMPLKAISKNT